MKANKISLICLLAAAALTACSDDKEYVAGEPVSPDCMGVYFDSANEKTFMFIPGEDATINVTVHRVIDDRAADIPLKIDASVEGLIYPATVHFDAGEKDAQFAIDCAAMPAKQLATVTVTVPVEYINPYKAQYFDYKAQVLLSGWENANVDGSPVKFWFTDYNYNSYIEKPNVRKSLFEPIESQMEVLPGAGKLLIHDFLGTGTDITLKLTPSPYNDFVGYYRIYPEDNFETYVDAYESDAYGDDWYNAWFIYDVVEDDYPDAKLTTLDGKECVTEYPTFFCYSDSYKYESSYANLKYKGRPFSSAIMQFSGTFSLDLEIPDYLYVFFTWDGETGL